MHDMGEAEDIQIFLHFHGADTADFAQVVPPQVYQHIMLGQFFVIGKQFFLQGLVFCFGSASRPCACQGVGVENAVFQFTQGFR